MFNTESMDKTILKELINVAHKSKNVGIFIDYDNVYYSMKDFSIDVSSNEYDICAFLNDVYGKDRIRTFRAYADFDQVDVLLKKLQENRVQIRNVYGNGKEEHRRKNASDIELSLDALDSSYRNPNIDTYVFVTADSDMIPIMSRMSYKGKQVHLFYMGENTSTEQHMETYANFACDILNLFNVDRSKSDPALYYQDTLEYIKKWHENPKNQGGKILGAKFLIEPLKKQLGISSKLLWKVINNLENEEKIEVYGEKPYQGYKIKEIKD